MTTTRKYYELLLDLFEKIVTVKHDNFIHLDEIRIELSRVIQRVKIYRLFELNLSDEFYTAISNKQSSDFETIQSKLAEELYNALGELLYSFESIDRETDYGRALEIYRTELPLRLVKKWNIKVNEDGQFSMEMLFFDMYRKWTNIDSERKYNDYKKSIREKKTRLRFNKKLKSIPKEKYLNIKSHFEKAYNEYQNYVFDNYPSICQEFSLYNSDVRVYIIDRNGQPGESTKQLNAYKTSKEKASINVSPVFYDFISRFNNLEEIEDEPVASSLGLFKIDSPSDYNFHFDISSIHHELYQIYIRNSDERNLKAFLVFLLRCELKRVNTTELNEDEIEIGNNKYCKLFLSKVPNLKILQNDLLRIDSHEKYSFAAFITRPDDDTIDFLKNEGIEVLIIESLARDHVNNNNGITIHWYIKSKLKDINIKKQDGSENKAKQLIQKLEHCPTGINHWLEYENICIEIFEYLFREDFRNYTQKIQSYTYDKIFRRDLVVNNNFCDSTSIWGQAKIDFNCNLIVIDFKNYNNPLEQNEFHLPSKYLNLVTGNFGIVISRKGLGNSAKILQKRMLNMRNELLLSIDDTDLIGMLRDKSLNQDPSYRLENLKFSLYEEL